MNQYTGNVASGPSIMSVEGLRAAEKSMRREAAAAVTYRDTPAVDRGTLADQAQQVESLSVHALAQTTTLVEALGGFLGAPHSLASRDIPLDTATRASVPGAGESLSGATAALYANGKALAELEQLISQLMSRVGRL